MLSALALFVGVALAVPCGVKDYHGQYTACRTTANGQVRSGLYAWNEARTCNETEPGSVALPPNLYGLRCNIACDRGLYLPFGANACADCAPGSVSLGGGILVSSWDRWPESIQFSTRCERNRDREYAPGLVSSCSGWLLKGWNVRSGNISDQETSILEARVTLVRNGSLSFKYMVDAEDGFDGFIFQIDNADQVVNDVKQIALPLVSDTAVETVFAANLSAGPHVLTWKYFKDYSSSSGEDKAFIKDLEIIGIGYADDSCSLCPAGLFAAAPRATVCTPCPDNTFASNIGSSSCQACDVARQFSYVGAVNCTVRQPCRVENYERVFGECQVNASAVDGRSRIISHRWLQPFSCDPTTGVQLPANFTGPCAPCASGFFRSDQSAECGPCPAGSFGGGANNTACQQCPANTAALRSLQFDSEFASWPSNVTSNCIGDCETRGWRLTPNGVDSGIGHGADVQNVLSWWVDVPSLNPTPSVSFTFTLECNGDFNEKCELTFDIVGNVTRTFKLFAIRRTITVDFLRTGRQELRWTFVKDSASTSFVRSTRVTLHRVEIIGASLGGATRCVACAPGQLSNAGATQCELCPSGQSAQNTTSVDAETGEVSVALKCVPCADGFYSPSRGRPCVACPRGTRSVNVSGSTACDDGQCRFSPDNGLTQYDLSPLKATRPFSVVASPHTYELNVCTRTGDVPRNNTRCVDDKGQVLASAYACQILESGMGVDVGSRIGYSRYIDPNGTAQGVIVEYTGGTFSCVGASLGFGQFSQGRDRSTNVSIVCDMRAGVGMPQPCPRQTSLVSFIQPSGVEPRPCEYCFIWRSMYGCPVCAEKDRVQVYGECIGGQRSRMWQWKEGRVCHGGVLPAPDLLPCARAAMACAPGQYLQPGASACESCAVGTYSLGNSSDFVNSAQWQAVLQPPTTAGAAAWSVVDAALHSVDGASESSFALPFFDVGDLVFDATLLGQNATLTVLVDGVVKLTRTLPGRQSHVVTPLRNGQRITFRFTNGLAQSARTAGELRKAIITGVRAVAVERALVSCRRCPLGTVASATGADRCTSCAAGQFAAHNATTPAAIAASTCVQCGPSTYSYAQSAQCFAMSAQCDRDDADYDLVYGQCINGTQSRTASLTTPRRCASVAPVAALNAALSASPVPCTATPICKEPGEYLDLSKRVCVPAPAGAILIRQRHFYMNDVLATALALGNATLADADSALDRSVVSLLALARNGDVVQTRCFDLGQHNGRCDGGWRERGWRGMDSGADGDGEILSELVIRESDATFRLDTLPNTQVREQLSFTATFYDSGSDVQPPTQAARAALYVYVDSLLALVVERNGAYEVSLRDVANDKSSVVTLRYYQERLVGQFDQRRRGVRLSNVVFQSRVGVAVGAQACPAGTFANEQSCTPCPAGKSSSKGEPCTDCPIQTFSPSAGSVCMPCGAGALSGAGATRCTLPPTCLFQVSQNESYDLTSLVAVKPGTNETDDRRLLRGLASGVQLELSPCLAAAACSDAPTIKGHVTELRGSRCSVVGQHPSFTVLTATQVDGAPSNDSGSVGFALDYFGSPAAAVKCNITGLPRQRVMFLCDASLKAQMPPAVAESQISADGSTSCDRTIVWRGPLGCPMCTSLDYETQRGDCINKELRTSLVKRESARCNGPTVARVDISTCTGLEYSLPWYGSVLILAVIIGLAAAALVLYNKYKKLNERYTALEKSSEIGMVTIDHDDDDDDDDNDKSSAAGAAGVASPNANANAALRA